MTEKASFAVVYSALVRGLPCPRLDELLSIVKAEKARRSAVLADLAEDAVDINPT